MFLSGRLAEQTSTYLRATRQGRLRLNTILVHLPATDMSSEIECSELIFSKKIKLILALVAAIRSNLNWPLKPANPCSRIKLARQSIGICWASSVLRLSSCLVTAIRANASNPSLAKVFEGRLNTVCHCFSNPSEAGSGLRDNAALKRRFRPRSARDHKSVPR